MIRLAYLVTGLILSAGLLVAGVFVQQTYATDVYSRLLPVASLWVSSLALGGSTVLIMPGGARTRVGYIIAMVAGTAILVISRDPLWPFVGPAALLLVTVLLLAGPGWGRVLTKSTAQTVQARSTGVAAAPAIPQESH